MTLRLRPISRDDAETIATLHAASWRSAYRGTLRDEFLDGDLHANRESLWRERLRAAGPQDFGFITESDATPIGFAYAFGHTDPAWGTLLDNLHVLPRSKGGGVGRALLGAVCERVLADVPTVGLFLWVYEDNAPARRFYERLGAAAIERRMIDAPGGGRVAEWRYAWPDPARLWARLHGA